jgi:hypothetical protein
MERLSHNHPDNSDELLSAYIDNTVDAGERRQAEQLIAACAACAQEAQDLRMFRALLRELPNVQPRRSFTLDPATVAPQRRLLFPTLRWSSLVAALLFVVVLGVDVLGDVSIGAQLAMPAAAPAAESAAKGYPQQFDSAGTSGGSADTMMVPQGSPAASPAAQGNAESASAPLTAEIPPATVAAPAASAPGEAAVPEASASAAPSEAPVAAAAPSEAPAARNAETAAALSDPAGGAVEVPQTGLRANEPAGADTINLAQDQTAQGSWWSSYGLRIAEVALGLIALVLGGAALWTWRRQL